MKTTPSSDRAAHRRTLAWLAQLSDAEHLALLKRAGILSEDGRLAERYRPGLEPESPQVPRTSG
jgi:hypothetical protein